MAGVWPTCCPSITRSRSARGWISTFRRRARQLQWCRARAGIESCYAVSYEPTTVDGSVALVVVVVTDISKRAGGPRPPRWRQSSKSSTMPSSAWTWPARSARVGTAARRAILGSSASDMVGTSILQLIPPSSQEEEPTILEAITRGGAAEAVRDLAPDPGTRALEIGPLNHHVANQSAPPARSSACESHPRHHRAQAGGDRLHEERERAEQESRRGAEVSAQAETEFRALFAANPLRCESADLATFG